MTAVDLPFSPVPTDRREMPIALPDDSTMVECPMAQLWARNYRDAALRLIWGDVEEAKAHAEQGDGLERAYMRRKSAEWDAEKERVGV